MSTTTYHKLSCKAWLEYKGKPLIGKGGAEILQAVDKTNSISKAAETLAMSYRYVWNYLQEVQQALDEPIVKTFKGGKAGGGGAKLTALGKSLLLEYKQAESYLDKVLMAKSEVKYLKLSARNQLKGKVVGVEKGVITAKVKVEVTVPVTITAVITKDAVEDLDLKVGDEVSAIVKSTEVMIAK